MSSALQIFNAKKAGFELKPTLGEMAGAFGAQHVVRRYGGPGGLEIMKIPGEFVLGLGAGLIGSFVGGDLGQTLGSLGRGAVISWAAAAGAATGIAANMAQD